MGARRCRHRRLDSRAILAPDRPEPLRARPRRGGPAQTPPPQEDWQPEGPEWETLGVASDGTLSAEWVGDGVVLLAVVAEDETVRILAWPRYPDEPPREGWQVVGTVNSLLQAQIPERESATVPDAPQSV